MSALEPGSTLAVPELAGRWTVWSQSDECPGGRFLVPADNVARATNVKYAVVKVTHPKACADPTVQLVRVERREKAS